MKKTIIFSLFLIVFIFTLHIQRAEAGGYFAANPDAQPSIFTYALRGMGVGALDGMAASYLLIYADVTEMEGWRTFLVCTGIGALGGSVLGFTVGFVDLAMYRKYPNGNYVGLGAVILRDALYGALFGTLAGAIGGGVSALINEKADHVMLGTAIGTLSGTGLGILIGVIEGRVLTRRHERRRGGFRISPSLVAVEDEQHQLVVGPGLVGSF